MMTALVLLSMSVAVEPTPSLGTVKKVHVDQLNGGAAAAHMRDLLIASLQKSGLFQVTEDPERADAFLRGSADEDVYMETHQSSDGVTARVNSGRGSSSSKTGREYAGATLSEHESSRSQERRRDAVATVRLVLKNGDVVWSTTQESSGAKFRGASADVADKVIKQLRLDFDRMKNK